MEARKIKLTFGSPKNGWILTKLESDRFELEFRASRIPENPTESLAKCLILVLKGIETQCEWNIEPEKYIFGFKMNGAEYDISIYKSNRQKNLELISEWTGGFDSVILPMYRGLKKHISEEFDQADWNKIDQQILEKLHDVVAKRKTKTAKNNELNQ